MVYLIVTYETFYLLSRLAHLLYNIYHSAFWVAPEIPAYDSLLFLLTVCYMKYRE